MAKRPSVESASDDDEPTQSTSQKRARFTTNDDEVRTIPRKRNKTRRNARDDDEEEDEEMMEQEDEDEDEDEDEEELFERFRAEHGERLEREIEAKRRTQGGVAEYGIIESIEMHQFMCHKYLTFKFGPQINFIIGHNGSGKSAVLSAITIALGGKSIATGRGNGLKSFIKEGAGWAEVTITLKNQGEEAFKYKEYGKSIVITRKWFKEGSSTWKIMTHDGKLISSRREELSAICDHMNIQVDNPMSVLTQDAARQFLSASAPSEKYKLFLRGTQLSQLSEEYETCHENIAQTTRILDQKREAIPDLRAAFKDASARFGEAMKARELKGKASDIKKELGWAHVAAKGDELSTKCQELANLEARMPDITDKLAEATATFEVATADVASREREYAELGRIDELTTRRSEIQDEMKDGKRSISDFNTDLKRMDQSLAGVNKTITDLTARIATETERMKEQTQAKQEETKNKINMARQEVTDAQEKLKDIEEQQRHQEEATEAIKKDGMKTQAALKNCDAEIQNVKGMIERARVAEKNALEPYGNNIKGVLAQIDQMRWHGEKPIGPLGLYVNAKDPQRWGNILRHQLAQYLTAFAVTDPRDQVQLKRLLAQSDNKRLNIIIYDTDLFDYGQGEPPSEFLTVLRALEISNPYVLRILINRVAIERVLLAPTRALAESELKRLPSRGGHAWAAEGFLVRVFPEGGSSSNKLNLRTNQNSGTNLLLTGLNPAAQIKRFQEELNKHQHERQGLAMSTDDARVAFNQGRQELDRLKREAGHAADQHRHAKNNLTNIQQEVNEELPSDVTSFEAALTEAEDEKKTIMSQFEDVVRQKEEVDGKQKALLTELNEIKGRIDAHNQFAATVAQKVQDAADARVHAQEAVTWYKKKLTEEETKVATVQAAVETLEEEFKTWTAKAQSICERFENPRTVAALQRLLESTERALEERERRVGQTTDQLAEDVNRTQVALETTERDYKQMCSLVKTLKSSLVLRLSRWQEFRRHIALRTKYLFSYNLSIRGYFGKVLFHHDKMTLILKVQTEDQVGTQGSKEKDPHSLSGGEKSFSTICLLLALWEAIGCPLRCLDEFDVFMDAVNRRIAMKMMIDMANSSDQKQYILITPQEMGSVQLGPTVKVNRMSDPERARAPVPYAA